MSDEELLRLYQRAIALIFPSLGGGFGFPPVEAIACVKPMVTTKYGSIPRVVGSAAHFVNGFDLISNARGIAEVIQNSSFKGAMINLGIERAATLSWQKCADSKIEVYEEVFKTWANR